MPRQTGVSDPGESTCKLTLAPALLHLDEKARFYAVLAYHLGHPRFVAGKRPELRAELASDRSCPGPIADPRLYLEVTRVGLVMLLRDPQVGFRRHAQESDFLTGEPHRERHARRTAGCIGEAQIEAQGLPFVEGRGGAFDELDGSRQSLDPSCGPLG